MRFTRAAMHLSRRVPDWESLVMGRDAHVLEMHLYTCRLDTGLVVEPRSYF
jgi:hypothetical protein